MQIFKNYGGLEMDTLVITIRNSCCDGLWPKEEKSVKSPKPDNVWLQSITTLKPKKYAEYVNKLFEKQKKEPQTIIICADVPLELTLKIAYATGIHKDPWIYFMDQNGRLTQIYDSALH